MTRWEALRFRFHHGLHTRVLKISFFLVVFNSLRRLASVARESGTRACGKHRRRRRRPGTFVLGVARRTSERGREPTS